MHWNRSIQVMLMAAVCPLASGDPEGSDKANSPPGRAGALPPDFVNFGVVTMARAFDLNGTGSDVDSIAFWEAPNASDTLMFVTGKGNDLVEVWKYPFQGNQLPAIQFPANVNGVAVDQETDRLYVSDRIVSIFSLPDRVLQDSFGSGIIGVGENNLALLKHSNGQTWIYVSDDHVLHRFNAATNELLGSFAPPVSSMETVVADDFYQMILVTEEQGPEGNPGVYAYHPDGTQFLRNGTNRFGNDGEFDSDEEGMILYRFPAHGAHDDGTGLVVVADQRSDVTDFEFFDRQTWTHLGTLRLEGVSNTDGIASTQRALPGYPLGVFAAIDDDTSAAVIGWDAVFAAIGWDLAPEAVSITPAVPGPISATSLDFTVVFSEPVSGFNEAADVVIEHEGSTHAAVTITGTGTTYTVTVTGISGPGSLTLKVSAASDVRDAAEKDLTSSVTSVPVEVVSSETAYAAWAAARGLVAGTNDAMADNPDGDAFTNLEEFATDGDPLSATDPAKSATAFANTAGVTYLIYTFPVRQGAAFTGTGPMSATRDGIVYTLSASLDLADFNHPLGEMTPTPPTGLPSLSEGWTYRTFQIATPLAEISKGFIRLSIAAETPPE